MANTLFFFLYRGHAKNKTLTDMIPQILDQLQNSLTKANINELRLLDKKTVLPPRY